jgi:hypothetical protein
VPLVATKANASSSAYGFSRSLGEASKGMALILPSSVTVTGTGSSATISSNGFIEWSSATTISINDVFSSTYRHYLLTFMYGSPASGTNGPWIRLRASGTDDTNTYHNARVFYYSTIETTVEATPTLFYINEYAPSKDLLSSLYVFAPYESVQTSFLCKTNYRDPESAVADNHGFHSQSSSYTGLTLGGSGTSGSIAIYGLEE